MKRPFIKTSLLLVVMIVTFSLEGYSKEKTIKCEWSTTLLNIDGSSEDWEAEELMFEKKLQTECAFKNDGENLYALFIFKDPKYLSSINATGMTIWINLEGKKKKNFGINFMKRKVKTEDFIALLEQRQGPLSEQEKNNLRTNPNYILHNVKVISKKKSDASASMGEDIKPAVFRSAQQENGIVYEFSIPLERKTEETPGVGAEPGKLINVCFEWGGLTDQMKAARAARGASGQSSGDRPMSPAVSPTESMDKGTGAGSMPKVRGTPRKYSFWINVQLAKGQ